MINIKKESAVSLAIAIIAIILIGFGIYIYTEKKGGVSDTTSNKPSEELMSLSLYVQDKEVAKTSDCGVTQKVTYQVLRTVAVADTSLKMLFEDELSQYGTYDSVTISDKVAKIMLKSDTTSTGRSIASLSSCESGHLLSVLRDTLTQYPTIKSVEIYSPEGKIEF
jgi:hypothetical protein